jgi:DNA-binding response OmpR family regulator
MSKEHKKIVFIDDDKWLLDLYTEKLRLEGFEVSSATNGKDGYVLIEKERPDLVVADVVMPNGDGYDLLKKVRANAELADIKIINLTNLANEQDEEQLLALGSNGYLVKADFTPSQFVTKLHNLFDEFAKQ